MKFRFGHVVICLQQNVHRTHECGVEAYTVPAVDVGT